ncbi:MAG: helix-turn-helix domain-containing protein [Nitrospira sp.]|nr:helix-turn-helix domain-containing protein [Nitrospira sp.]
MTLSELADELGISHQQLQKYETGTNRISASMIVDLVQVLNIPIEELFRGIGTATAQNRSPVEKARQACRVWIDRTNSAETLQQMARVLKALSGKE